jgi:hypothetical protein
MAMIIIVPVGGVLKRLYKANYLRYLLAQENAPINVNFYRTLYYFVH